MAALIVGTRVKLLTGITPTDLVGTFAEISEVNYATDADRLLAESGNPALADSATVTNYQVKSRSSRANDVVTAELAEMLVVRPSEYKRITI